MLPCLRVPDTRSRSNAVARLPLCIALLSACAGERAPTTLVTDSAGISIVQSEIGARGEWSLVSPPFLDVSSEPDGGGEPLYRIVGVAMSGDHIVVGNRGSHQLFLYDSAGDRVASVGREGGGPGEFRSLSAVLPMLGDSILTYDSGQRRYQVFDREGTFVRSFALEEFEAEDARIGAIPLGILDGETLVVRSLEMPERRSDGGTSRATIHVFTHTLTGDLADSILSVPGWEAYEGSGSIRNMPIPFAHSSHLATSSSEIVVGSSEQNEVRFYGADGRLRRILRNTAPTGTPVRPDEIAEIVERGVETAPRGMAGEIRNLYDEMPVPDTKPPFNAVFGWGDESLWVSTSLGDESVRRILVFDRVDGRSAWLSIPREFRPMYAVGDGVLGVWTDALGVETLRGYRIYRGPGDHGTQRPLRDGR